MILRSLKVRHFRNLEKVEVQFDDGVNLIVGANGQGKTNLLEAIYFLGTTKSFRTTRVQNLVAFDEDDLFVEGTGRLGDTDKTISIGFRRSERKRELILNADRVPLREFVATLPLFAYSAARLEILRGGPEERRRFLDRGIATRHPSYLSDLSRNQKALRQRNALLQEVARGRERASALEPWDQEWVRTSALVVRQREDYCATIEKAFGEIVRQYRYPLEDLSIEYAASLRFENLDHGIQILRAMRQRELDVGFSLVGPHRDNVDFLYRGIRAEEVLSSGETKMAVLFLKMAKVAAYSAEERRDPIFLLDDVDAELDLGIIETLLRDLRQRVQLFTTSSKGSIFGAMALGSYRKYTVENGNIREVPAGN